MNHDPTDSSASFREWDFPTLALIWDPASRAVMAGGERLASVEETDRTKSLTALSDRVVGLIRDLDDSWLVATAFFMVDDLYKSCFCDFGWNASVAQYISATAGPVLRELTRRGYVLHDVINNTQSEATLFGTVINVSAVFRSAGLLITGPVLMALELMERDGRQSRDPAAIRNYREEGHFVANKLIERCHAERCHSVYLNMDFDDDTRGFSLDVALSQANTAGTIVVFRTQPPATNTVAQFALPPGVSLPTPRDR